MKKGILTIVLLVAAVLGGCSMEQKVTINSDFSSDVVMECYTTKADEAELMQSLSALSTSDTSTYDKMMREMGFTYDGTKIIDGEVNNCYTADSDNSPSTTKSMFMELTSQKAVMNVASEMEEQTKQSSGSTSMDYGAMDFCKLTITYPFKVAKTNGVLQEDGYTVAYDLIAMNRKGENRAYAVAASGLSSSEKVTIKGVKNQKAYKKAVTVSATSDGVIASFKVNGKEQAGNSYYANKNGKYVVEITTASGKKVTRTFYVDKKKPTTNIKNKKTYTKNVKITFKDSISGIKKATLNGKKIKSGKRVKKNGNYTLKIYDKAGNVKTVKFKIQK